MATRWAAPPRDRYGSQKRGIQDSKGARETFVKQAMERWRQNSVQDDETWPTERLEAMFGDSFDASEMGIFEGHSQRELL